MEKFEQLIDKALGAEGEEGLQQAKTVLASLFSLQYQATKALHLSGEALKAIHELIESVEHSRDRMKEGYEKTKELLSPETLQKVKGIYEKLKKFGILNILDGMTK